MAAFDYDDVTTTMRWRRHARTRFAFVGLFCVRTASAARLRVRMREGCAMQPDDDTTHWSHRRTLIALNCSHGPNCGRIRGVCRHRRTEPAGQCG